MAHRFDVEFTTRHFSVVAGEDEETNPGVFGRTLSEWLAEALRARGTKVSAVIAEDWGRCVIVHRKPFMLWVGCSNVDEAATRWRVIVVAEFAILGKLLGRTDPKLEICALEDQVRDIVHGIPQVSDVQWTRL